LARSLGKTEIGALIAGKINKAVLANAARVNLKPNLLSVMLFSFPPWFSFPQSAFS
jgi:hypothetical protein